MAFDPRQIAGAVLTLSMFAMLGNMVKRDHFDTMEVKIPTVSALQLSTIKTTEQSLSSLPKVTKGPWKEDDQELKPCWMKQELKEAKRSKGYVTFALTRGPEYHLSQIADAVVVASYLGAALVLPDIRGNKSNIIRRFQEVYDVDKFVKSLDGVVEVVKHKPAETTSGLPAVKVPNRVTSDFIAKHVEPMFRNANGHVRIGTYFPTINMKKFDEKDDFESVACLARFGTLELQPEVHEVVDSMIGRLRTLSRKTDGKFIAVDLRVDMLQKQGCKEHGSTSKKSCFNAEEIGMFLKKIGFSRDTTIYLTQTTWDSSLDALKGIFPKTYTKEEMIPADKKSKFLNSESADLEKTLDFYVCSRSDVFVPAISGMFYANVAGKRIANGRTQILVPTQTVPSLASPADFISPYVSKKDHMAYSCFC